jgi:signal transduction histidine kinase
LDSLTVACYDYPNKDTIKVKMLLKLASEYYRIDPEKGLKAAEEAVELAQMLNQPLMLADAWNKKGINQNAARLSSEAILSFTEAMRLYESVGAQKLAATMLGNIGIGYATLLDYTNAAVFYERSLKAQEKFGDQFEIAKALMSLGTISSIKAEFNKAIDYISRAIQIFEGLSNYGGAGMCYLNLSTVYNDISDYPKTLELLLKALSMFEKINSKSHLAKVQINISVVYVALSDFEKALEYSDKALAISESVKDVRAINLNQFNRADILRQMKNYAAAFEAFERLLILFQATNDADAENSCYNQLGALCIETGDYARALGYAQNGLALCKKADLKSDLPNQYSQIGAIYLEAPDSVLLQAGIQPSERYAVAESNLQEGLKSSEAVVAIRTSQDIWKSLSSLYEKKGDYVKAYDAFKHYITIRDSIVGEDTRKQITRKEIQYEFDKKEATLKLEQQLTLEQLEQQKLLSIQQQQSLRLNQQSLALSNKEKDIQRLAYLKEKAEKQEKEQQLSLAEKDKQLQDVQLSSLIQEKALQLKTLAEKNALIGFLIAGISAILLAFAAFYWWIRQRQAKKEAASQAQFTRQLLENIEDDRGRIAIDLHDSVSHDLLLLKQSIRKEITGPEVGDKIDNIINGIRQISRNLHPVMLDKIGLGLSLETLCEQFMQHETMYVSHEIAYQNTLSKSAELQLFRIVQEGLTNALKYSKAEAAKVQVKQSGNVFRLEIQDNGKGFDVEKALEGGKAFGLHSILQRAKAVGGKAEIRSGEGGTTISVVVG